MPLTRFNNQHHLTLSELQKALDHNLVTVEQGAEQFRLIERERAAHDLHYLTKHVLDYSDLGAIHAPLCSLVSRANSRLFQFIPHDPLSINTSTNTNIDNSKSGGGRGGKGQATPTKISTTFSDVSFESINGAVGGRLREFVRWEEAAQTRLWLMFRASFKTTVISIAHTIQLMLLYPDIRILIASHKKDGGSAEILRAIKQHFIANPKMRHLFPEYCPKPNQMGIIEWGTTEKVTLPNRSPSAIFPEATIEIAGHTTDVTGRHYDYIKADDLVTKDSVTNETMIGKTRQYFSLLKFLFNQPEWGLMDVVGTPYHFNDLYATLRKSKGVSTWVCPIEDKEGNITFPERFTKDGVKRFISESGMSSYEASCQMYLNPIPTDEQVFRPEYFERPSFYYSIAPNPLKVYVFVDPANKRRKDSDYTAIISIGVNQKNEWYLLDIIRDKLGPDERIELALKTCKKWCVNSIYYETIGFQDTDAHNLKRLAKEQGYQLSVNEIKASSQSKEDRIRGLQVMYERGDVHWPVEYKYYSRYEKRTIDMVEVMRDEALMFPKCEHDDLLDCHSFALRAGMFKAEVTKEIEPLNEFDRVRQIMLDAKDGKPYGLIVKKGIAAYRSFR